MGATARNNEARSNMEPAKWSFLTVLLLETTWKDAETHYPETWKHSLPCTKSARAVSFLFLAQRQTMHMFLRPSFSDRLLHVSLRASPGGNERKT